LVGKIEFSTRSEGSRNHSFKNPERKHPIVPSFKRGLGAPRIPCTKEERRKRGKGGTRRYRGRQKPMSTTQNKKEKSGLAAIMSLEGGKKRGGRKDGPEL